MHILHRIQSPLHAASAAFTLLATAHLPRRRTRHNERRQRERYDDKFVYETYINFKFVYSTYMKHKFVYELYMKHKFVYETYIKRKLFIKHT